jgi:hypothetical protein
MGTRRKDIPTRLRMQLAVTMLNPDRPHGLVTALAHEHRLSRQSLYDLAAQAEHALLDHLEPARPGPALPLPSFSDDRPRLARSILRLTMAGLSQRDVCAILTDVLEAPVSLGTVNATLSTYEARAARLNAAWHPAIDEGLAADELFADDQPHLLIVGNDSLFIYALTQQPTRDAETWGCLFLDAPDAPQIGTDGGSGLAAGLRAAGRETQQLDWDHLLRSLWLLDRHLETQAYSALTTLEERARYVAAATTPKRLEQHWARWETAQQQAEAAMARYDQFHALARAVDAEFAMIELPSGQLRDPQASQQRLEALAAQIKALPGRRADVLGTSLGHWAAGLVSYLPRLAAALAPLAATWGAAGLTALQRLWQVEAAARRGHQGVATRAAGERLWQASLDEAVGLLGEAVWAAYAELRGVLGRIWRGSMAAECVNSLLRPLLRGRKQSDQGCLELFRFVHNTHRFPRGKRAGQSPAELVGIALPSDPWSLLDRAA